MNIEDLKRVAYAMESAYRNTSSSGDAVHDVRAQFKDLDIGPTVLIGMWMAIDAYVDLQP
jgi:hypothetical protein